MKWCLRLVPFLFLSTILFLGFFVQAKNLPNVPLCFTKWFYGFDCPGCGMTRACLLLPRGEFFKAIHFNAAAPAVYLLALTFWIDQIFLLLPKLKKKYVIQHGRLMKPKVILIILAVTLGLGHWMVKIYKLIPGLPG